MSDVALLVPCYQAARFLPAFTSELRVLTRSFSETYFYDDGSTDSTVSLAASLGIPLIRGEVNQGVSHARNQLAQTSKAEWLHFHDVDDPIVPDFLALMEPLLGGNTDVAVCDTDWLSEDQTEHLINYRYASGAWADPLLTNLRAGISCNGMIVRRSVFLSVGGFDPSLRMWEDADLHVRLAAAGARYAGLGAVAAKSVRRAASFSHDYRASWNWRLHALESYGQKLPARVHSEVANQSEIAARHLLRHGDKVAAERALALNHRMGGNAPETSNALLHLARRFLSPLNTLRIQEAIRRISPRKIG